MDHHFVPEKFDLKLTKIDFFSYFFNLQLVVIIIIIIFVVCVYPFESNVKLESPGPIIFPL